MRAPYASAGLVVAGGVAVLLAANGSRGTVLAGLLLLSAAIVAVVQQTLP